MRPRGPRLAPVRRPFVRGPIRLVGAALPAVPVFSGACSRPIRGFVYGGDAGLVRARSDRFRGRRRPRICRQRDPATSADDPCRRLHRPPRRAAHGRDGVGGAAWAWRRWRGGDAPESPVGARAAGAASRVGYAWQGEGSMSSVSELVQPDASRAPWRSNWLMQNLARIAAAAGRPALLVGSTALAFLVAGVLNATPALIVVALRCGPLLSATRCGVALLRRVEAFAMRDDFRRWGFRVRRWRQRRARSGSRTYFCAGAARELGIGAPTAWATSLPRPAGRAGGGSWAGSFQRRFGHGRAVFAGWGLRAWR